MSHDLPVSVCIMSIYSQEPQLEKNMKISISLITPDMPIEERRVLCKCCVVYLTGVTLG